MEGSIGILNASAGKRGSSPVPPYRDYRLPIRPVRRRLGSHQQHLPVQGKAKGKAPFPCDSKLSGIDGPALPKCWEVPTEKEEKRSAVLAPTRPQGRAGPSKQAALRRFLCLQAMERTPLQGAETVSRMLQPLWVKAYGWPAATRRSHQAEEQIPRARTVPVESAGALLGVQLRQIE